MKIYCSRDKSTYILDNISPDYWVHVRLGEYRYVTDPSFVTSEDFGVVFINIFKRENGEYYFYLMYDNDWPVLKSPPIVSFRDKEEMDNFVDNIDRHYIRGIANKNNIKVIEPVEIYSTDEVFGVR